jgi:hypothetical protein
VRAESYIADALETQRQLGYTSQVSDEDYQNAIERTAGAFDALAARRHRSADSDEVAHGHDDDTTMKRIPAMG